MSNWRKIESTRRKIESVQEVSQIPENASVFVSVQLATFACRRRELTIREQDLKFLK